MCFFIPYPPPLPNFTRPAFCQQKYGQPNVSGMVSSGSSSENDGETNAVEDLADNTVPVQDVARIPKGKKRLRDPEKLKRS